MEVNVHSCDLDVKNCAGLAVAVLAGGKSRRFGADKALLRLCSDGRTLIEAAVDAGRSVADETFVIGHERYSCLVPGIHIVPDDLPGEGPLAAIRTALRHASSPSVLVLACDMPCLSIPLLRWMGALKATTDVVIPRTGDGRWQPMPAIYRRSTLPTIDAALQGGSRSITSIFDAVTVREILEPELRQHDPALNSLFSLNSPDQLDRAKACHSCN